MVYLKGKIRIGIKNVPRHELDNGYISYMLNDTNSTVFKNSKDFKVVFFLSEDFEYKYQNEQTFDEIIDEVLNDTDKGKVKETKDVIATVNVEYYVKYNEKFVKSSEVDKRIRSSLNMHTTSRYAGKRIVVYKNTYTYKKSIDVLDEIVKNKPYDTKYLFNDLINEKDAEILSNSFAKYLINKKDISKVKLSKDEIFNKYKTFCKNKNLNSEVNRIFEIKDNKNIQGVNYLFNEENIDLRQKSYEVLANALYSAGRITNPSYSIVEIDIHERDIRPLLLYLETRLRISRNELYFFEFVKRENASDPFSNNCHDFTYENNKFYKMLKENQYINTFGIHAEDDTKAFCESLLNKNLIEMFSFVEFTNKLNKEAQIQYAKEKLLRYGQKELIPIMVDIIEYQDKQYDGLTTAELDAYILNVFKGKYEKVYKPVYKNITKDMLNGDILDKLMNMVGLFNLKKAVNELCNKVNFNNLSDELVPATKALNKVSNFERNNWILTGVPGTGKSTAAEILEKVMYQQKIIKKDILIKYTPSRNDNDSSSLFSDIIRTTSSEIVDSFMQAIGGVLVVDEIGHLSNQDKTLLLQLMEENKRDVSVILCGYENEAKDLLDYNPGFRSRFTHIIKMEEYTKEELYQILQNKLSENDFRIKAELKEKVVDIINNIKAIPNFGEARFIESLSDKLISIHSSKKLKLIENIVKNNSKSTLTDKDIYEIDEEDIDELPLDEMTGNEYSAILKHKDAFNELHNLIGCINVKQAVDDFVSKSEVDKIKIERKLIDKSSLNMNMVFYGSPGTAKTTVARLVGKIMYNKGIINTPKMLEVGASDLVAAYVGQTAMKTANVFKKAKGGVLFIDEAYALANDAGGFNQEAIDTIIKEMENCRNNTMVIFAGYKDKMEGFIKCNPGFKSRISKFIDFPNYSREELIKIFIKLTKDNGYQLDENKENQIINKVDDYLEEKMSEEDFGNGRVCRTILEDAINKQSKRILALNSKNISNEDLMTLKIEDFSFETTDFYVKDKKIGFLVA